MTKKNFEKTVFVNKKNHKTISEDNLTELFAINWKYWIITINNNKTKSEIKILSKVSFKKKIICYIVMKLKKKFKL